MFSVSRPSILNPKVNTKTVKYRHVGTRSLSRREAEPKELDIFPSTSTVVTEIPP